MMRTIAICVLVCTIGHHGFGEAIRMLIETSLPNPNTVVMNTTLYTISKTNRTLSINSTDSCCKVLVDPFDENIQGRISAVPLVGARKIIVWGIQSSNIEAAIKSTYYTLLIVDPIGCSYRVVPLPKDTLPASWPSLLPQVVAFDNTFYIFFATHQKCSPCWFGSDGQSMALPANSQLEQQGGVPLKQFWVKAFFTDKYKYLLHAYNFENGTALIELVDDYSFRSVTKIYVNHTVDAASVAYGTYQNTAICYISRDEQVTCARLNKRLVPGMSWKLPPSNLPVLDVCIDVDQVGNTFIGTINSKQPRIFVYNADGGLFADYSFGQVNENYTYRQLNGLRFGNYMYCLDAVAYYDRDDRDETRQTVRCINVKRLIN